jgi:hypothetical protein
MKGPQRRPHKPPEGLISDPKELHDLKIAVGWEQTGLDPKLAWERDPRPGEWALAQKVALVEAPRRSFAPGADYDDEVAMLARIYAYRRGSGTGSHACSPTNAWGEAEKVARALLDQHAKAETYRGEPQTRCGDPNDTVRSENIAQLTRAQLAEKKGSGRSRGFGAIRGIDP